MRIGYESRFHGSRINSKKGNRSAGSHTLSWTRPVATKMSTTLPKLEHGEVKSFGYRVDDPEFDWRVTLTPGVKGTVSVKFKPFINQDFVIGPFWLNALKVNLGTIKLDGHAGTTTQYTVTPGQKSFSSMRGR